MTQKPEVDITRLHPVLKRSLTILDALWPIIYPNDADGLNITSGHEEISHHTEGSRHYIKNCKSGFGEAFDIRIKDVEQYKAIHVCHIFWTVIMLREKVDLKIYPEALLTDNAHIHIQLF